MTCRRIFRSCAALGIRLVRPLASRFFRTEGGVALVEFALISPFLIALLLGSFEITRYINSTRRITYLASTLAEIVAQNTTGLIDWTDLLSVQDATMVTFPDILADAHQRGINWWSDIQISIASVAFTPTVSNCTSSCTYNAGVAWNYGYNPRPCNTPLTPASDTAPPTPTTLPVDVYGPGSLIVVDIVYNYRPIVANAVFGAIAGPLKIVRSFYIQPRYVSLIKFNVAMYNGIGYGCSGY